MTTAHRVHQQMPQESISPWNQWSRRNAVSELRWTLSDYQQYHHSLLTLCSTKSLWILLSILAIDSVSASATVHWCMSSCWYHHYLTVHNSMIHKLPSTYIYYINHLNTYQTQSTDIWTETETTVMSASHDF